MKEEWKEIQGYAGRYEVSNLGRVRGLVSSNNGRTLKNHQPHILSAGDNKGYCRVILLDDTGKRRNYCVHRLVASAFIGDCTNLEINHIDGNKKNNIFSNLEICDKSYNTKHAYRLGLMKPCNNGLWKAISVFKNGKLVNTFASIRELCREMKLDRKSVQRTINGQYSNHHGFTFAIV